jgi:hypothetical protein
MSDLGTETPESPGTAGSGGGWQHETADPEFGHRRESPAGTRDYAEYEQTQAGTEARIAVQDELPSPVQSRAGTWGDDPEYYDEIELAAAYDGDLSAFLAAEDDLPTPQESRTRTWGDNPEYHDETSLASGDDGPGAQPASGEGSTAGVLETPSPQPPPDREHGDAFTGPAAEPDGDQGVPDAPPEADLKQQLADLRNEYETGKAQGRQQIYDLRAELQALKDDRPQPAPEATGDTEIGGDQPHAGDRKLTTGQEDATEATQEDDRPGPWSNAKTALYGAVGATATVAGADQFFPGAPHPVIDIVAGGISIIAAYVPVLREGWKRRHDNPPDKP